MKNTILGRKLIFGDTEQIEALRKLTDAKQKPIKVSEWSEEKPVTEYKYFDCIKFECIGCGEDVTTSWECDFPPESIVFMMCKKCSAKYEYDHTESEVKIIEL